MIIGGFYEVNCGDALTPPQREDFPLPCNDGDRYQQYYTNNGRTATVYTLLNGLNLAPDDVILLPEYLCVSVVNAFEAASVSFQFYRLHADLSPDIQSIKEKMSNRVKAVYVIHYFGVPQSLESMEALRVIAQAYEVPVIEDLTQTLYSRGAGRIGFGEFLVASTRKWLPMTDGGLVAVKRGVPFVEAPLADAYDIAAYRELFISALRPQLQDQMETSSEDYLAYEKKANAARYVDFTPREMTEFSYNVLMNTDHNQVMKQRRENYTALLEGLSQVEGVQCISKPLDEAGEIVPFGFLIAVEHRDDFYHHLARKGIVGEIQWVLPTDYYTPSAEMQWLSAHNILLQCDQRYSISHMAYVVTVISDYMRDKLH